MGNEPDQLLPQGTQSLQNMLPVPPSNDVISHSRSNLFPLAHSYVPTQTFPHQYIPISNGSQAEFESNNDIETAAQHVVLHEQEISTQKIIQSQRESLAATAPSEYSKDFLSEHHDPNSIKEHLLKMATHHRSELASNVASRPLQRMVDCCNSEIGNGYGVPGGGAYYDASIPNVVNHERDAHKMSQNKAELDCESGQKSMGKDLPKYLKQKLRARGILKDDQNAANSAMSDHILGRDPKSGAAFYYNQNSGTSQWERPLNTASISVLATLPLPENWLEAFAETTVYTSVRPLLSQFKSITTTKRLICRNGRIQVDNSNPTHNLMTEYPLLLQLLEIWEISHSSFPNAWDVVGGEWILSNLGAIAVTAQAFTIFHKPAQYLSAPTNKQQTISVAKSKEDLDKKSSKHRSDLKPPRSRGYKKDGKK